MGCAVATSPRPPTLPSTTHILLLPAPTSHPRLPVDNCPRASRLGAQVGAAGCCPPPTCVWWLLVWLRGKAPPSFILHNRAGAGARP